MSKITQKALREHWSRRFGPVSKAYVSKCVRELGCPLDSLEAADKWREGAVSRGIVGNRQKTGEKSEDGARYAKAKAEKMEHDAAIAKMERAKLEGELVTMEEATQVVVRAISPVSSALDNMPPLLCHELANQTKSQVQKKLRAWVEDVKTRVHKSLDSLEAKS